jgi:Na+-transporting methylmalonyl-CoA/oxaloacetate decarboxylase gamma subunit
MKPQHLAAVAVVLGLSGTALTAQTPGFGQLAARPAPRSAEAPATVADDQTAEETREELLHLLTTQYPPSLPQVLRLDPSLLTNTEYLTLYPALASFLGRHPEVSHNPAFFLGGLRGRGVFIEQARSPRREALDAMENVFGFLAALSAFALVLGLTGWGLKTFVDHRRWLRVSKIQTDAHSKLLDRLTSNEDLLAYIQSPAGRQFLEAAPFATTSPRAVISAPVNRILWSTQAGIVLALGGAGLWYSRHLVIEDVAQPLAVLGALLMFLGVGFVLSALVAYALSKMLGLFDAPALHPHS